jgi:hypothetical protein
MIDEVYAAKQAVIGTDHIVRVAAGTYKPRYMPVTGTSTVEPDYSNLSPGRDATFILRPGVEIRGGYDAAGGGTDGERDGRFYTYTEYLSNPAYLPGTLKPAYAACAAILTGDFNGDDEVTGSGSTLNFSGNSENAHHVVLGVNIPDDGTTILDGFTVRGGNADGASFLSVGGESLERSDGGGIYNESSSPVLANLTVFGNSVTGGGGGIGNSHNSFPVLSNAAITRNSAGGGGGIQNFSYSSPVITNVVLSGNNGPAGGGLGNNNHCSPVLTNVTSTENNADAGGGIYNSGWCYPVLTKMTISGNTTYVGGGIFNYDWCIPVLINVILSGNIAVGTGGPSGNAIAGNGGGIYNCMNATTSVLINVTVSGNKAGNDGGGIFNYSSSSSTIQNSIIWGNTAVVASSDSISGGTTTISYSVVEGPSAPPGTGNSNADPLFAAPEPAASVPTTAGDYSLSATTSPAYNAGDDTLYPDTWAKWIAIPGLDASLLTPSPGGFQDIYDAYILPTLDKDITGITARINYGTIDMGAYEF